MMMTFNVPKQGVMKVLRLIVFTGSAMIALFSCGNELGVKIATQPARKTGRTFANWCREQASLSPETKHTVRSAVEGSRNY